MITSNLLQELIDFARRHSPFYSKQLAHITDPALTLDQLPVINPVEYWRNSHSMNEWPVLTGSVTHALVFRTGGSTGAGKLSVYTRQEWQTLVRDFGASVTERFKPGDRVANLFYAGDLYASFLFTHDALAYVDTDITEFPFTGNVADDTLIESITAQRINVLAGLPARLLTLANELIRRGQTLPEVRALLYAGESLFTSQREMLWQVFPNARIDSLGYASVDAGYLGASSADCADGEHRVRDGQSLLEIIDEESEDVIDECGRIGLLVVTSLTRRLMPLLRYPVGDRACWLEAQGSPRRKFMLKGRSASSQRVRVGILSLMPDEIGQLVKGSVGSDDWQLVIEQAGHKDVVSLKWVPTGQSPAMDEGNRALEDGLLEQLPLIEHLRAEQLLELHVRRCPIDELPRHPRSGKCLRVLDLRVYESAAEPA